MYSIVTTFFYICQNLGPSGHFTEASRHNSQNTKFLTPDFLAACIHNWLNIYVLGWRVCHFSIVIFVLNLDEETATDVEKHSKFKLILA